MIHIYLCPTYAIHIAKHAHGCCIATYLKLLLCIYVRTREKYFTVSYNLKIQCLEIFTFAVSSAMLLAHKLRIFYPWYYE